jgi:hypothetical protein
MTYTCIRCNGTGEIAAHRNVLGGVCFKCHGTGKQERKPAAKSKKYLCKYDGIGLFTKSARSEAEALRKAVGHWRCHPHAPAFANIDDESQITVEEYSQ